MTQDIVYRQNLPVTNKELNALFATAWPGHTWRDFGSILAHSLVYVCAYEHEHLIGFVHLAWDGGVHAFVLDPTVHPSKQRQGIGRELIRHAAAYARQKHIEWLHVDFESSLQHFYDRCGFCPTRAGLLDLKEKS